MDANVLVVQRCKDEDHIVVPLYHTVLIELSFIVFFHVAWWHGVDFFVPQTHLFEGY